MSEYKKEIVYLRSPEGELCSFVFWQGAAKEKTMRLIEKGYVLQPNRNGKLPEWAVGEGLPAATHKLVSKKD
jgi:hypothetical protein